MGPQIPALDLALVNSWVTAVLSVFWPVLSVIIGVIVGAVIVRAFRRALAGGGGGE